MPTSPGLEGGPDRCARRRRRADGRRAGPGRAGRRGRRAGRRPGRPRHGDRPGPRRGRDRRGGAGRRPGQARREDARGADRRGARGPLGRHDRDRRPGPDVPQGDRQGRPPDRRGGGRPGQGDRARRVDGRVPGEGDGQPPRVDPPRHGAQDPDRSSRSTACRSATRRTGWCARRSPTRAPPTSSSRTPTSTSSRPAGTPSRTARRCCSRRPGSSWRRTTRRCRRTRSSPLLDWAYFAVHNGDLDSRDNVGLRAIYDWTRDDVAFPALERWIEAGHDADLLKHMGYDPEVPLNTKLRAPQGRDRADRARRPRAADVGQPAPGRLDRQEVHRPRDVVPGPDPGGQHRPDPGGREVRLREGLQVLHLRHVVDPAGDHPRDRRPGPHDPDPGPHGGDDQPPDPGLAGSCSRSWAASRRSRRSPRRCPRARRWWSPPRRSARS